jgi:hypothetical protein
MALNLAPAKSMKHEPFIRSSKMKEDKTLSWPVCDHDAGYDNHDTYRWRTAMWPLFYCSRNANYTECLLTWSVTLCYVQIHLDQRMNS